MDKYSKIVLKFLNKYASKDKLISIDNLYKNLNIDETLIDESIKNLKNELYIESEIKIEHIDNFHHSYPVYCSTIKGKEFFKEQFKNSLKHYFDICLQSIFCPIIVSFLTALITTLIAVKFSS